MVKLLTLTTLLTVAQAHVLPEKQASNPMCGVVQKIITSAKQQSAATAFCSSYLSIPVVTKNGAVSTSTLTASTITSTVTTSTTEHSLATETSTSTVTDTTTSTSYSTCPQGKAKRATASKPKPTCFKTYSTGAPLSSVCRCLSIPASTTTKASITTTTTTPVTTTTTTSTVSAKDTTTVTTTSTTVSTTVTEVPNPSCATPATAGPLITDGNFEDVPDSDLYIGGKSSSGWSLTGEAYFESNPNNAYSTPYGQKYACFYGGSNDCSATQTTNVPTGDYVLTYSYSVPYSEDGICTLHVLYGGVEVDSVTLSTNVNWTTRTPSFHAGSASSDLVFRLHCNDDREVDTLIDNVSIVAAEGSG